MTDDSPQKPGKRAKSHALRFRADRRLLVWGGVAIALLVLLAVSLVATEQSSFCPSCHEMRPYYAAWQAGGHASRAQCVDCHVDSGVLAHLAHKPTALKEVWDHFFVDVRFPNYSVAVPSSRCTRDDCHATVTVRSASTFSHAKHMKSAECKECHATSGHLVTLQALQAEGVLKAAATTPPVPAGLVPSALVGHPQVSCQKCHDQTKMKCSVCHQAPHEPRGECSACHAPGQHFVFDHAAKTTDCAMCHRPPASHFGADCSGCHSPGVRFQDTKFTHPARVGDHSYLSFACVKCHPTGYSTSSCTCHGGRAPGGGD